MLLGLALKGRADSLRGASYCCCLVQDLGRQRGWALQGCHCNQTLGRAESPAARLERWCPEPEDGADETLVVHLGLAVKDLGLGRCETDISRHLL